jgi:hypothetical protein
MDQRARERSPELEPGPKPEAFLSPGMKAAILMCGALLVALLVAWYFRQ